MEQAERGTASRSQSVMYLLPRTADALARILAPALERIDTSNAAVQLLVVTPDAETAIATAETAHTLTGAQGIEIVPVTAARRAARLMADRPVHAVAGPAIELHELIQRSALKLDALGTIVLAWVDDDDAATPAAITALEAVFAEVPKDSMRVLAARRPTEIVEAIAERYLRGARRVAAPDAPDISDEPPRIGPASSPVNYVIVSPASRPAALRRLLDELDPPSAAIVVRDAATEADAGHTVRSLGYRRADDPVRVVRYDAIPAVHTVVLYDAPVVPSELAAAAEARPVQIVVLATPRDLVPLHELTGALAPMTLAGPGAAARSRDALLRDELATVLRQGIASRELITLEPLLDRYDGTEIAAAALRLLETERAQHSAVMPLHPPRADERGREERAPGGEHRGARERRGPRDQRPHRDERPPRQGHHDRHDRHDRGEHGERGDHGERGERRPPRDQADRPDRRERNLGRGPRFGGAPRPRGGGDERAPRDERGDRTHGGGGRPPRGPRPPHER